MSDNIPFEIQMEIIKKVSDVKSLIMFRSVSKPWKSFIESSEFIAGYGARDTQPHHSLLLRYKDTNNSHELKHVSFLDDENHTLTQQQQQQQKQFTFKKKKQQKQFKDLEVIGSSHGLLCFVNARKDVVIWNPCIRKSVRIELPYLSFRDYFLGFMVCPVTNAPTIVTITYPWHARIFTLTSKRCKVFQYTKLPRKAVKVMSSQVVVGSCIYWVAYEVIPFPSTGGGSYRYGYMIVSFDLIAEEIRLVDIPPSCILNNPFPVFFISKLRESVVLFVTDENVEVPVCDVWKMEHDESFTKLFTISTPDYRINNILGFRKNGELVMEIEKEDEQFTTLELYEPCSEHVNNLGISGENSSFFMSSYKETLLLLDELDCCVCSDF